jgi:hypothetical protein
LKRGLIIVFLSVLIFQCSSGLFILISFAYNREYISQTLCINRFETLPVCKGKCYLKKQLNEQQQKENKFPDLKQKEIQLYAHKTLFQEFESTGIDLDLYNFPSRTLDLPEITGKKVFHPPRLA